MGPFALQGKWSKGKGKGHKGNYKGQKRGKEFAPAESDPYGGELPKKKAKKNAHIKCFECGGYGHRADQCPSNA